MDKARGCWGLLRIKPFLFKELKAISPFQCFYDLDKTGKDKTVEDLETLLQDETVEINTFF